MGFVSYPYLILLISGQIFEVTIAHGNFWELNGPLCTFMGTVPTSHFYDTDSTLDQFVYSPKEAQSIFLWP